LLHQFLRFCISNKQIILSVEVYFTSSELVHILIMYRLRYGVQLEKGPFDRRTSDFLWMMIFGSFALLVCLSSRYLFHLMIANVTFILQNAGRYIL